jgi:hypothetical protein
MSNIFRHKDIVVKVTDMSDDRWKIRLERVLDEKTNLLNDIDYWDGYSWTDITLEDNTIYIYGDNGILEFNQVKPIII